MRVVYLCLVVLLAAFADCMPAMAAECTGTIPVIIADNGSKEEYTISVKEKDTDGFRQVDQIKVKAGGRGTVSLSFTEPGSYEYLVEELPGDQKDINYDKTVFHVEIQVVVEGEELKPVICVTSEEKEEKMSQIFFLNQRIEKQAISPQTGDINALEFWLVLLNLSLLAIAVCLFVFQRRTGKSGGKGQNQ